MLDMNAFSCLSNRVIKLAGICASFWIDNQRVREIETEYTSKRARQWQLTASTRSTIKRNCQQFIVKRRRREFPRKYLVTFHLRLHNGLGQWAMGTTYYVAVMRLLWKVKGSSSSRVFFSLIASTYGDWLALCELRTVPAVACHKNMSKCDKMRVERSRRKAWRAERR